MSVEAIIYTEYHCIGHKTSLRTLPVMKQFRGQVCRLLNNRLEQPSIQAKDQTTGEEDA